MDEREGKGAPGAGITRLGYALLGLIRAEPRSGYKLRMVFETTPLALYSSSPGSIYPALKSLARAGLVTAPERGARQVFALTAAGEEALGQWLARLVDEEEVARHLDMALLRFAFLQEEQDEGAVGRFLDSFEAAADAHAASLEAFLGDPQRGAAMSLHSRIAVEHGLRAIRCSAEWAADARRRLCKGDTR
jgi:DNA-binding PadR family transcriptional regulator